MLRLKYNKDKCDDCHRNEHLINHSCPYLVFIAVAQEMNDADYSNYCHIGKTEDNGVTVEVVL